MQLNLFEHNEIRNKLYKMQFLHTT